MKQDLVFQAGLIHAQSPRLTGFPEIVFARNLKGDSNLMKFWKKAESQAKVLLLLNFNQHSLY